MPNKAAASVAVSLHVRLHRRMLSALLLTALLAARTPVAYPKTYLASITGIKLGTHEFVDEFSIDTWGVTHRAICHFPPGWFIDAGSRSANRHLMRRACRSSPICVSPRAATSAICHIAKLSRAKMFQYGTLC